MLLSDRKEGNIPAGDQSTNTVTKEPEQVSSAWNRSSRSEYYGQDLETTLANVQPFTIDVKGGGKESKRR